MNERIKELADKVDRIKDFYSVGPVQRAALEDFADLIIKECIDLLLNESERLYSKMMEETESETMRGDFEILAEKCVDNAAFINEHFGVE